MPTPGCTRASSRRRWRRSTDPYPSVHGHAPRRRAHGFPRDRITVAFYSTFAVWGWLLYSFNPSVPLLADDLGISDAQAGLHGSSMAVGAILAAFVTPRLVRGRGRRPTRRRRRRADRARRRRARPRADARVEPDRDLRGRGRRQRGAHRDPAGSGDPARPRVVGRPDGGQRRRVVRRAGRPAGRRRVRRARLGVAARRAGDGAARARLGAHARADPGRRRHDARARRARTRTRPAARTRPPQRPARLVLPGRRSSPRSRWSSPRRTGRPVS